MLPQTMLPLLFWSCLSLVETTVPLPLKWLHHVLLKRVIIHSRENTIFLQTDKLKWLHLNSATYFSSFSPLLSSGNYFASHFFMGGEKFDTPHPEGYLFGENMDLNFLGNRPVQVRMDVSSFNHLGIQCCVFSTASTVPHYLVEIRSVKLSHKFQLK